MADIYVHYNTITGDYVAARPRHHTEKETSCANSRNIDDTYPISEPLRAQLRAVLRVIGFEYFCTSGLLLVY